MSHVYNVTHLVFAFLNLLEINLICQVLLPERKLSDWTGRSFLSYVMPQNVFSASDLCMHLFEECMPPFDITVTKGQLQDSYRKEIMPSNHKTAAD